MHGLTSGVRDFAEILRRRGHTVHLPDLFQGRVFDQLEEGLIYAQDAGFDVILERAVATASGLPDAIVYAGFSLGVLPAQKLAQTKTGARGALLFHSCLPISEFGGSWPDRVPVQVHAMAEDPFFANEGDLEAARDLIESTPEAELFLYGGEEHLFADRSLVAYDEEAANLLTERVLEFLDGLDR